MKNSSLSWKSIGEVAEIVTGSTPKKSNSSFYGGAIPWIKPGDVQNRLAPIRITADTLSDLGVKQARILPAKAILVTCISEIGRVGITDSPAATNQQINAVIFNDEVVPEYGLFAILYSKKNLERASTATTVPILNKSNLQKVPIPILPKEQQVALAGKMRPLEIAREARDASIKLLDNYLRSLFIEMFGDPTMNPKNWPKKKFKSVADIKTGNTPSRTKPEYYGDHIEWIKSDNLNTPYHFATNAKEYLSKEGAKVGRVVPPNSILVTCIAGSKECIGNAAIVDRSVAFNQQINSITCRDELVSEFVYSFLLVGKKIIQSASTNSMKGMVSKSNFEEIEIYVPPKKLQIEFASKFAQINTLKIEMEKSSLDLNRLFQSLLAESFTGSMK